MLPTKEARRHLASQQHATIRAKYSPMPIGLVTKSSHELSCINVQGFCQDDDIDQSNIALSPFNRADVRAMQARVMRECFL